MVTAYPMRGKLKSATICQAFIDGCSGRIATDGVLRPGTAVFYGVDEYNEHVWKQARARHDYVYIDNAFFDQTRGEYFRASRNRVQHDGVGRSNGKRFDALGLTIEPWRAGGTHIVICPQSDHFMRVVAGLEGFDWTESVVKSVAKFSARPPRVRIWSRDKGDLSATLPADLSDAHALVTWSSAAAVTAVLSGVPIVTCGPSAATPMSGDVADIENLPRPERREWAGVLADNQWTLAEMADGVAWRTLNG